MRPRTLPNCLDASDLIGRQKQPRELKGRVCTQSAACSRAASTSRARRQHPTRKLRKQVLDAGRWRQRLAGVFAGGREFERGGAVEAAFDQPLAEELVAAGVGSALELGEHREVRLYAAHLGG